MRGIVIASSSSGQGKTSLTLALLAWLKDNNIKCRPFKSGPDYIDTQFHEKISSVPSINLDNYLMSSEEIKSLFAYYSSGYKYSIVEGVMGYYDGLDYNTSTYDLANMLNMPVLLVVPAQGTYNTIVPIIKGLAEYRKNSNIKAVILNRVSSESHYERLKECINNEMPEIKVLGWIKNGIDSIKSRHLGLDIQDLNSTSLHNIYSSIIENIDVKAILNLADQMQLTEVQSNPFDAFLNHTQEADLIINKLEKKVLTVVKDNAFSFIYQHNIDFFDSVYKKIRFISVLEDNEIPYDTDVLYIPGGYVETTDVYPTLISCNKFKTSLINFSDNPEKKVYAECAGLMYIGRSIFTLDGNIVSGANILPIDFAMSNKRNRLGYYKAIDFKNLKIYKGHCFHYSIPQILIEESSKWGLFKEKNSTIDFGAWTNQKNNVLGTYLHSFFFNQPELIQNYFI